MCFLVSPTKCVKKRLETKRILIRNLDLIGSILNFFDAISKPAVSPLQDACARALRLPPMFDFGGKRAPRERNFGRKEVDLWCTNLLTLSTSHEDDCIFGYLHMETTN
jgi:hypothetical protein